MLTVKAGPARLQVECDDVRVAQLIANTLDNAGNIPMRWAPSTLPSRWPATPCVCK